MIIEQIVSGNQLKQMIFHNDIVTKYFIDLCTVHEAYICSRFPGRMDRWEEWMRKFSVLIR